ncbi:MAG: methylmalonyl-CoA epimerase [Crocinitomicaceae bacterium]|nr:methylmalonyl-CoA epimerase [Crocinitomicaceae bacterium]
MKRIEHIGIAVADLNAAERIFTDVLGDTPFKREHVESEGVHVSFFQTGESKVELLASASPDSPIGQHLAKRGEGLHHLAFFVDDIRAEIDRLQNLGYRIISGPKDGADNKEIAFLHPSDTNRVLLELCAERG